MHNVINKWVSFLKFVDNQGALDFLVDKLNGEAIVKDILNVEITFIIGDPNLVVETNGMAFKLNLTTAKLMDFHQEVRDAVDTATLTVINELTELLDEYKLKEAKKNENQRI